MNILKILIIISLIFVTGCFEGTIKGIGQLTQGIGTDIVHLAEDNEQGDYNRYSRNISP